MSRLTVTEAELKDVERNWTGTELFKLSNAQLHDIIAARGLTAGSDANKKMLVKAILDEQSAAEDMENEGGLTAGAGDSEVAAENLAAAASSLGIDNAEVSMRGVEVKPPVAKNHDDMLIGSDKFDAVLDLGHGVTAQLGSVVANAQAGSGLSVDEWNALGGEERDEYIEAALHEMRRGVDERMSIDLGGDRLKELDEKMAANSAKRNFKGLFEDLGASAVAVKNGEDVRAGETLFGHIDDLPNPLA